MEHTLKEGLKVLARDDRDFKLGAITVLPQLTDLPSKFVYTTLYVGDQKDTDFCTAFASDLVSSLQEMVIPCSEWGFAIAKSMTGDPASFGMDIRDACKRHTKYGMLPQKDSTMSLTNTDPTTLRYINNWPKYEAKGYPLRKGSYFRLTGPYDAFDNIRATIWQFKDKYVAPITGVLWGWPLTDKVIEDIKDNGTGHCIAIIGWDGDYAIVQNSAGYGAGDQGKHKMHRRIINNYASIYGAFAFLDIDPVDVTTYYLPNNIKIEDGAYKAILKSLLVLLQDLYNSLKKNGKKIAGTFVKDNEPIS